MHISYISRGTQHLLWGKLTKYKCLMPTQNRLPNALVEKVEGGLSNFKVRTTN